MPAAKRTWTAEEDAALVKAVEKLGQTGWSNFSSLLPGRTGKQCRDRWYNHLRPMVKKGEWTEEEDRILFDAQRKYGNAWSRIANELLPGRTDLSVKNRYYSYMRKLKRRQKKQQLSLVREQDMASLLLKRKASEMFASLPAKRPNLIDLTTATAASQLEGGITKPLLNFNLPAPVPNLPVLPMKWNFNPLLLQNLVKEKLQVPQLQPTNLNMGMNLQNLCALYGLQGTQTTPSTLPIPLSLPQNFNVSSPALGLLGIPFNNSSSM